MSESSRYERGALFYEGKAKNLFEVKGHPELIWQEFKDSLTAFNALKKGSFADKGLINRKITQLIFEFLESRGVKTHLVSTGSGSSGAANANPGDAYQVTRRLQMIKAEVVVRNVIAGSTAKKFNLPEGSEIEKPLVELYYKDDALADPFISDEQALFLKVAKTREQLDQLKAKALEVNAGLLEFFSAIGIRLIDFKLEFGWDENGDVTLADEITPDSCRLWDAKTSEKMDKDRFRRDLGNVRESYQEVLSRMEAKWGRK